jgi:large conductance mechanosensitive channel
VLKEFRSFVLRGNVVDLAVAVVLGAAFGAVVASLVANVITPIIAIPGTADFSQRKVTISGSDILYGQFINDVLAFLLIALAVFLFVVKPVNRLMALRKTEPEVDTTTKACPECLSKIPINARKCAFCASSQG